MTMLYLLARGLGLFCFSVLGRREVVGLEAVPRYGPLIIVANHLSDADPPLLATSLPRTLDLIGKIGLFSNPLSRMAMRWLNVHPLDPSGINVDTMRVALRLLAQDHALVIFPEAHRSPDHTMKQGMSGAAYLALKSQAPILPVGIIGTEKIPGWRMLFPLCRFTVNIGQPFTLPVLEGRPSRQVVESMRDMIMYRIAALLPEAYRGVYALTGQDRTPIPRARQGQTT
jgi:1-acyl-sn-glycerol-3-phosphate acyltransferase